MRRARIGSVTALLERMGFKPHPQIEAREAQRIRAAFVKCEAQRDGTIRGRPHTMLNDGDIDQHRHIRGAVGAIVASVFNGAKGLVWRERPGNVSPSWSP